MSFGKFPLSPNISKTLKAVYKSLGITIWAGLLLVTLISIFESHVIAWFPNYVFWIEVGMIYCMDKLRVLN